MVAFSCVASLLSLVIVSGSMGLAQSLIMNKQKSLNKPTEKFADYQYILQVKTSQTLKTFRMHGVIKTERTRLQKQNVQFRECFSKF